MSEMTLQEAVDFLLTTAYKDDPSGCFTAALAVAKAITVVSEHSGVPLWFVMEWRVMSEHDLQEAWEHWKTNRL